MNDKKIKSSNIGVKLALIMLCVILLGIVLTVGVSTYIAGNVIMQESLNKVQKETEREASNMNEWLASHKTALTTLSSVLSKLKDYSKDQLAAIFKAELDSDDVLQDVYMGFTDNTAIMGSGFRIEDLYDWWKATERPWYNLAMTDTSHAHITSPYVDSNTGKLCITASQAVYRDGVLMGVVGIDILITKLQDVTLSVTLDADGYAVLIDTNGDLLIHPNEKFAPDSEGNFQNLAVVSNGAYSRLWNEISASDKMIKYKDESGEYKYYTVSTLDATGWRLMTVLSTGVVTQPIITVILIVIPLTLIIMVIAAIVIFSTIKNVITLPMTKVIENLSGISSDIESVSTRLDEMSNTLADGSSRQAEAIEEISATITQELAMITNSAESTRNAAKLSESSRDSAKESQNKMSELSAIMEQLKNSSDVIGQIVRTIDDIAFQTNLLAINATVEAARAGGEAGMSFAVVADEVRKLAHNSAEASAKTTEIIEKNISLTNTSRDVSRGVVGMLKEITQQFENLFTIITNVNMESEDEAKGIEQINIAMANMEKVMQANSASAKEISQAVSELADDIQQLHNQIGDVNKLIKNK